MEKAAGMPHEEAIEGIVDRITFQSEETGYTVLKLQTSKADLTTVVGELPPKCRHAFLLHRVHGAEFSEIAKEMGLSERMVRHYVLRAVLHCRAGLDAALNRKESGRG